MSGRGLTKVSAAAAVLVVVLGLAGCESTKNPYDPDKPLDKMSKEEWCTFYAYYLTNPNISAETRASAVKQMHNRGCPNRS